jgi:hypothetical protein
MKTAVEWLVDELYKQGISLYTPELIEQAKEIEKEQSHAEYMRGWKDGLTKQQEQWLKDILTKQQQQ